MNTIVHEIYLCKFIHIYVFAINKLIDTYVHIQHAYIYIYIYIFAQLHVRIYINGSMVKKTYIHNVSYRNGDGHYALDIKQLKNEHIFKYCPNKFTRYNSLSLEII